MSSELNSWLNSDQFWLLKHFCISKDKELRIISLKKVDEKLLKLRKQYENKIIPKISIGADTLMSKYKIPEGKQLGKKLKMIEEEWVKNNFKISDQQVEYIVKD